MAAKCEELKLTLTGNDCLDILTALQVWLDRGVTEKSEQDIRCLIAKVTTQYNTNQRLCEEDILPTIKDLVRSLPSDSQRALFELVQAAQDSLAGDEP